MRISRRLVGAVALVGLFGLYGCGTPAFQDPNANRTPEKSDSILLREGDILRIAFPGAPNLSASQQIRRDGKITLPLGVGEVQAAGKTPTELERALTNLYSGQLVMNEINVSVESSLFSVYVNGAVLRPGKVDANRPITALEAIMEAGGPDYNRANLKEVTVLRTTTSGVESFKLDLKRVLQGKDTQTFYLKPSDIVRVPERFSWF